MYLNLDDNGKPVEKPGRKAKGSKTLNKSYDSLAAETGFLVEKGSSGSNRINACLVCKNRQAN
jgi:hypothetical protein